MKTLVTIGIVLIALVFLLPWGGMDFPWSNGASAAGDGEQAAVPGTHVDEPVEGTVAQSLTGDLGLVDPPQNARAGSQQRATNIGEEASDSSVEPNELLALLEDVAGSVLTAEPDLPGMQDLTSMLASRAMIDEASVKVDPDDGSVTGEMTFGDSGLSGTFTIRGDHYNVAIMQSSPAKGFVMRGTDVSLTEDRNGVFLGRTILQWHPDLSAKSNPDVEAEFVGWSSSVSQNGTTAAPIKKAPAAGGAWQIGNIGGEPIKQEWETGRGAYVDWLELLRGYRE